MIGSNIMKGLTEPVKISWGVKKNIPEGEILNYSDVYDPYTNEKIRLVRRYCDNCHHSVSFLKDHFVICSFCGNKVYPNERSEFKDKLIKELKKRR